MFYVGLHDGAYWWEILASNLRKVAFVAVSLAAKTYSQSFQAIAAFSIMYINHIAFKYFKPYIKDYLNYLDLFGSTIAQLTILSGLMFVEVGSTDFDT